MVQAVLKKYSVIIVLIIVSFVGGMYSRPAEVKLKEVVKINTVVKEVHHKSETGRVVEKTVKSTDGTIEIIKTTDYSISSDTHIDTTKVESKTKSQSSTNLPSHQLTVLKNVQDSNDYDVIYSHRIISTFYLSVGTNSSLDGYSIGISWGF